MPDQIRAEYESYTGLWHDVGDTDKLGIISRLEELLDRSHAVSAVELSAEIENTIATIQTSLDKSRSMSGG